jgi:hypothetical protein
MVAQPPDQNRTQKTVTVQGVYEYTTHCNKPQTISPREWVGVQRGEAARCLPHPDGEFEGRKSLKLPP